MAKVLVLYYSAFGYVAVVANALAEGARAAGAAVDVKRVPDTRRSPLERSSPFQAGHGAPVATIEELADYDAIVVGSPTRFGRLASPVAAFLEEVTDLTGRSPLTGKVGAAFASPTGPHGGHETAAQSLVANLLHLGLVVVGPPYSPTTVADAKGQRHPSNDDLEGARQLGARVAQTAARLAAG